jgi:hypothetical protein
VFIICSQITNANHGGRLQLPAESFLGIADPFASAALVLLLFFSFPLSLQLASGPIEKEWIHEPPVPRVDTPTSAIRRLVPRTGRGISELLFWFFFHANFRGSCEQAVEVRLFSCQRQVIPCSRKLM